MSAESALAGKEWGFRLHFRQAAASIFGIGTRSPINILMTKLIRKLRSHEPTVKCPEVRDPTSDIAKLKVRPIKRLINRPIFLIITNPFIFFCIIIIQKQEKIKYIEAVCPKKLLLQSRNCCDIIIVLDNGGDLMTLYVSDLDGTLLGDSGKLRPRTADMLNSFIEGGTMFSYCTARGLATAGEIMSAVHLNVPVVLMNGVYIYDPVTGEYPVRCSFGAEQCGLLKRAVTEYGEKPMIFAFIEGRERVSFIKNAPNLKAHLSRRKGDSRRRPLNNGEDLFDGEMFYAAFIDPENLSVLESIFTPENGFMTASYTDTYPPHQRWFEVFPASAGKANAIQKLKELTGADEVVCFGDNANDLSMFRAADRCYAVENAIPELKEAADGVIGSNEQYGVTEFIQKEVYPVFAYEPPFADELDAERFRVSVEKALERERTTIGTLNEKTIHNALKCYYCDEADHEAKIGDFYADGAGENGIFEIQSGNFSYLAKKLSQMLLLSHVTVVYPYEKKTHNYSINEKTGEVMSVTVRTDNSYSKLFLELYRIKAFLTNPNLTVRIAFLELDKKTFYKDERRIRRKGMKKEKCPTALLREIRLENAGDYRIFLPDGLPEQFTRAELQALCRTTDASLMLSVLEFTGTVVRCGKRGNSILYERQDRI